MKVERYGVFDLTGALLKVFSSYKGAQTYKIYNSRMDWEIRRI